MDSPLEDSDIQAEGGLKLITVVCHINFHEWFHPLQPHMTESEVICKFKRVNVQMKIKVCRAL